MSATSLQEHILRLPNYIDGEFRPPIEGKYIDNINPSTGSVISYVPDSNAPDIDLAVAAAKRALASSEWNYNTVTLKKRAEWLKKLADGIEARLEQFAQAESRDTGKPLPLARTLDIPRAIDNLRYFAEFGRHYGTDSYPSEAGGFHYTSRRPVGVVGLITPWNLPLYLLTWKVAPALMMGNAIVAKPSEITPTTATLLAELCHEIGLPNGVFNLVHGTGPRTGQAILEHRDISAISFTGGTVTGGVVASVAGRTFKKLSLELGGKNPNVIFADCDFDRAVETTLRSSFANSGQICLCGSRILVEDEIYDKFLETFVAKVKSSIIVGPPADPTTTMGPVISEQHRNKIEGMIKTAKEQGGKLVLGGKRPTGEWATKGWYLEPTIITDIGQHCQAIQEEIFGPVVTISRFSGYDQALALANGVKYGLSATVWTSNLEKAHRFAQNVDSGMVWVNNWLVRDLSTPFGGVKDSGVGREGGRYSLEFFSESKNIYIHLPPYTANALPAAPSSSSTSVKARAPVNSVAPYPPKEQVPAAVPPPAVSTKAAEPAASQNEKGVIDVAAAPKPVGAYPHARVYGDLLFLSGIGPRTPGTNAIPGGPIRDADKKPLPYDVKAQTRQVVENIRTILHGCGATLDDIIDVQVFLIDMDRDFADFNAVYAEYFSNIKATRTTIAINALPTPIAVEFKVIARAPGNSVPPAAVPPPAVTTKAVEPVHAHPPSAPAGTTSHNEKGVIDVAAAPKPVGAYPHARVHGDLLFLSGIGPRTPGTNAIPGGPIRDADKKPLPYDVKAQTRQVVENIRTILHGCGATLDDIIDVQVFLIDMDRDFADFNAVYAEYFSNIKATRTTIAINALPTPIAVEFKVIARAPVHSKK